MATKTEEKRVTCRDALIQVLRTCQKCGAIVDAKKCKACGAMLKPRTAKEIIGEALELWASPAGKTPKATASSQLLYLTRDGLAVKPERGMVIAAFPKK